MNFALEALLRSVGLVRSDHLDEAKAARLFRVRITHDVALLHLTVLLKQAGDLFLGQAGVDASHEEIGAGIAAIVVVVAATCVRGGTSAVAIHGRGAAGAGIVHVAAVAARGPAAVAVVATGLIIIAAMLRLVLH